MIDVNFNKFMKLLNTPSTLDNLLNAHSEMLENIKLGCFLSASSGIIHETLMKIIECCSNSIIEEKQYQSFNDNVKFLFRVLEGGCGVEIGMDMLLMRLDFNGWARSH